ncbi:hypothetical protein J7444_23210 [Labrenzia sp. R4_1]|uniref:hypothetical protein n=1 Tax=Labrenzia sp. R4_1 TaxID=2821106 RepID=UPI001ADD5D99|nr:hypothetical protein [Labrenzia sp. R4_1]MBO9427665.1 hypothetical protein [Labrenzia sp. R4_1]
MTEQTGPDDCIWMVRGHLSDANSRGWQPAELFEDNKIRAEEILKAIRQSKIGWQLSKDQFPKDNYPRPDNYPATDKQSVPQIFSSGFTFLSEESADVVGQFDLGDGALYPTRLWRSDRITPMPGRHFYLNVASKKDAFLPEQSLGAKDIGHGKWLVPVLPRKDTELWFADIVLNGPDLWFDPKIIDNVFISDRLKQALDARKLSKDWMLTRCSVVVD